MTIRFGVAGTGWVAGEYFKGISHHPDSIVSGVYSRNRDYANARLAEFGIQANVYDTFEEMVKDPGIDAVVLCSTPDVRPEQAVLAARHGKHLVIEKPVALDRQSLRSMAQAIEQSGVRTVVSFVLRWNPMFDTIKSLLADDAVGSIFMAQLDYWNDIGPGSPQYKWSSQKELGGSSMMSAGCHAIDALRYFAGEVTEVTAYSCKNGLSGYEFDPNVLVIMKLQNGGIAKVSVSLECKSTYKLNVHLLGEKGTILNDRVYSTKYPGQVDYATIPTILPGSGDVSDLPFAHEIADLIQAVRSGTSNRCDFFDACKTMELCYAIDESIAKGETVVLAEENKSLR